MKLKYYMRGLGVGILLTAIILSIGTKKEKLTDQEIISRAKQLGMVMAEDDKLKEMLTTTPAVPSPEDTENKDKSDYEDAIDSADTSDIKDKADSSGDSDNKDAADSTGASDNTDAADSSGASDSTDNEDATGASDNTDDEDTTAASGDTDSRDTSGTGNDHASDSSDMSGTEEENDTTESTGSQDGKITFTIERGMSSEMVSALLKEKGLIENQEDFNKYIISKGKASFIKIGTYTLPVGSSYKDIINAITK